MKIVRALGATTGFGVIAALVAAACSGASGTVTVGPAPDRSANPAASADDLVLPTAATLTSDDPPDVFSWTDDEAIQGLAKDCHWDPKGCIGQLFEGAKEGEGWVPPEKCKGMMRLACAQVPGQMCAPDGCAQSDYQCIPECDSTCNTCNGGCTSVCETCKGQCHDDACKLGCAEKCGACHQSCLTELDHCTSEHCAEEEKDCFKNRDDRWEKSNCEKVCPLVSECVRKCPFPTTGPSFAHYESPCANACAEKLMKGCPSEFDGICRGDPDQGMIFWQHHEQLHPEPTPPAKSANPKGH